MEKAIKPSKRSSWLGWLIFFLVILIWSGVFNNQKSISEETLTKIKNNVVYVKYDFTGKSQDGSYFENGASGSGIILNSNSSTVQIYTNRHVIDCGYTNNCYQRISERIKVRTQDGIMHDIQRVYIAPHNLDLAMLEFSADNVHNRYSSSLIRGNDVSIGERVIAIGYPGLQGIDNVLQFSISEGKIINIQEFLTRDGFSFNAILSDAYANFGSSGGGLFDSYGNLLGITTWKTGTQDNIAISANSLNILNGLSVSTSDDSQKWTICENHSYVVTHNDRNFCTQYCSRAEILGEDSACHNVCTDFYCKSDKISGDDTRCNNGYIYGSDGYCHAPCGSKLTYCPSTDSVCFMNNCASNCRTSGKYLFDDGTCRFWQ